MRKRKEKRTKNKSIVIILLSVILFFIVSSMVLSHSFLIGQGYYPLDTLLDKLSYKRVEKNTYQKNENGLLKEIYFDFDANKVMKNGYAFDISNQTKNFVGRQYVSIEKIKEIFNVKVQKSIWSFKVQEIEFATHQWTEYFPNLIAHAGGTYREKDYNTFYTNSLEALQQNYSMGHRVFEMDFYLTSDGKMAAVHDWNQFGYMNGVAMSSDEWKKFQTFGSPMTASRFTTLLVSDVLDQMLINKDMFLVTDTKSFEVSEEEIVHQFSEIYNEAMKRSPELLNRIIPQIYNQTMYTTLKKVYDFPSVIYTLYVSPDSPEQVIEFVANNSSIKVVTIPLNHSGYFNSDFFNALHALDKKVYTHTIHTYDELTKYSALGIDGFYTGLLLPSDMDRLTNLK